MEYFGIYKETNKRVRENKFNRLWNTLVYI